MSDSKQVADVGNARTNYVRSVIDNCVRRRVAGEAISDESLIAAHPDLMPELADELRKLRSAANAHESTGHSQTFSPWRKAAVTDGDSATLSHRDSDTGSSHLEVRCPNCRSPTEVAVDTALTDITCSACGSHFSLVDQTKATRMAPSLTKMGRFELIERLGVGGYGSVWKARDKELDRTVAVKIPRQGGMAPDDQEKFFREARAAAQLRHPSIVSVHEVGRDGDSVYIVSDFVRGVTLGDWLTAQKLTSHEAAELCAKIADALHHAHQQGVVHRDLKPANIMIDGDGNPHLMDFGLARREVGEVTVTMDGQVLGTPAYMSPEQAQGEAHTADRRSDVYSLGVILFQLLTGELPFRGNARMLMHQVIHDEPPSPRKLNANVPKDLETIVLKCLDKSPARRYQSTEELAAELRRFLKNEPIQARPLGRLERGWRWVGRNKAVSALSSAVALAMVVGTAFSTYFAANARQQAEVALAKEKDALTAQQESESARSEEARARREAEAVTELLIYKDKGRLDEAIPLFEETLDNRLKKLGADHKDTLTAMTNLAVAYADAENYGRAILLHQRIVASRQAKLGPRHSDTLASQHALAHVFMQAGKYSEAIQLFEATRGSSATWAECLAAAYKAAGRTKDALTLQESVVADRRKNLGFDESTPISDFALAYVQKTSSLDDALTKLAAAYDGAKRPTESISLRELVLSAQRARLGPDHADTLATMSDLGNAYRATGRVDDAVRIHQEALALRRKKLGPKHDDTIASMKNLVSDFLDAGQMDKAINLRKELLAIAREQSGPDHDDTLSALENLASAFRTALRFDEAADTYRQIYDINRTKRGNDDQKTLLAANILGYYLWLGGHADQAIPIHQQTLSTRIAKLGEDHTDTLISMSNLASAYVDAGQLEEGIHMHERTLEGRRKLLGAKHSRVANTAHALAYALHLAGRHEEAIKLNEDTLRTREENLGVKNASTLTTVHNLLAVYNAVDRHNRGPSLAYLDYAIFVKSIQLAAGRRNEIDRIESQINDNNERVAITFDDAILGDLKLKPGEITLATAVIDSIVARGEISGFIYNALGINLLALDREADAKRAFMIVLADHLQRKKQIFDTFVKLPSHVANELQRERLFDPSGADFNELTAAYFLDLMTQDQYASALPDQDFPCVAWLYIGQKQELTGNRADAVKAYQRCAELSAGGPAYVAALAQWRLKSLATTADGKEQ